MSFTVYLASPKSKLQAEYLVNMPALICYSHYSPYLDNYIPTFERLLVDSGAYSEFTCGKKVDIEKYKDWSAKFLPIADAIAGLDDISGDWKRSLKNYEKIPWGFPTFHEADPPELLKDLVDMSLENTRWLGVSLLTPRTKKELFLRDILDQIPEPIHVHGWALRYYTNLKRLNSVDSTNWFRAAMQINKQLPWLTDGECLDIVVKKYKRWHREISENPELFWNQNIKDGIHNETT